MLCILEERNALHPKKKKKRATMILGGGKTLCKVLSDQAATNQIKLPITLGNAP